MNLVKRTSSKNLVGIYLVLFLICSNSFLAKAALLTSEEETIEAMIDAQTANITYLLRAFGDVQPPALDLSFVTTTDFVNKTFSFSTSPGSAFNGQSLDMDVTGAFNTTTSMWDMSSSGSIGTDLFSGTGSMLFDLSPLDPDIKAGAKGSWLWGLLDYRSEIMLSGTGGFSRGDIIFTIAGNDVGRATVHDRLLPVVPGKPRKYKWRIEKIEFGLANVNSPGVAPQSGVHGLGEIATGTPNGTFLATIDEPAFASSYIFYAAIMLLVMTRRRIRQVEGDDVSS